MEGRPLSFSIFQDEAAGASEGAAETFFGRPRPAVDLRGDLRGDAVLEAVFGRLAAGAFLGEAGVLLFLFPATDPDAGRLLVPDVTRLGPVAGFDVEARLEVAVLLFFGAADLEADFLFVFLVFFAFFAAFFAGAFLVEPLACLFRVFNSCLPASAILKEARILVKILAATPFARARRRSLRTRVVGESL